MQQIWDEEMKKLLKYLEASKKLQKVEIDVETEVKKILKKELHKTLQKTLNDMVENGDLSKLFEDLGLGKDNQTTDISDKQNKDNQGEVDQMVAAALLSGFQTTNILKNLFGIVPNLIGR